MTNNVCLVKTGKKTPEASEFHSRDIEKFESIWQFTEINYTQSIEHNGVSIWLQLFGGILDPSLRFIKSDIVGIP